MRLIHLFVPDEQSEPVYDTLDDLNVDYATSDSGEAQADHTLVQFPLPTNAVEPVVTALTDAGVDTDSYTIVDTAETALTPNLETLQKRYAQDYTPLATFSLRSKTRDMNHDTYSYVALVVLSAVIAAAGLLVDSPAVVVGSMVIAPLVGPMLATGVGAVTGDFEMLASSLRQQTTGVGVGVVGAATIAVAFRLTGVVPPSLDPTSLDLVTLRMAPGAVALLVGVAGGSAAAFGLTTQGPISIIGVMIAAALVPAAGVVGIGLAWGHPVLVLGALALLVSTLVAVNASVTATLLFVGYRSNDPVFQRITSNDRVAVVSMVLLVVVVVASLGATGMQMTYDRNVNAGVEAVLDRPAYDGVSLASVSTTYASPVPFQRRNAVTLTVNRPVGESYPSLPDELEAELEARTGTSLDVRVEYVSYDSTETRATATSTAEAGTRTECTHSHRS